MRVLFVLIEFGVLFGEIISQTYSLDRFWSSITVDRIRSNISVDRIRRRIKLINIQNIFP